MTITTSGPISFRNVSDEFGGTDPIGFDEYYRGGSRVPAGTGIGTGAFFQSPATSAQIPTSGPIQLSQFYGTNSAYTFTDVVSANITGGYSLGVRAQTPFVGSNGATGWDGVSPLIATVTINYGVTVSGPGTSFATWRLAANAVGPSTSYPVGSQVTIVNYGNIIGAGGGGGAGGGVNGLNFTAGGAGGAGGLGVAFNGANITTYMYNYGTIGGGGGGGGGGNSTLNTFDFKTYYGAGGGGGGEGAANNLYAPGAGGVATGNTGNYPGAAGTAPGTPAAWRISPSIYTYGYAGAGGLSSGVVRGGTAGAGGEAGFPGFPGNLGDQGYIAGGQGTVGAGGARGAAVVNGGAPSWGDYGNIRGAIDSLGFWASGGANYSSQLAGSFTAPLFNSVRNPIYTALLGEVWYGAFQNCGIIASAAGSTTYSLFYTNTGAPFSAHLYGAVDNYISTMTVNGVVFSPGSMNTNANWYGSTYQTNAFTIVTGFNVITITVVNTASSACAFNLRLRNSSNVDQTHPSMWYIGGTHGTPPPLPPGSSYEVHYLNFGVAIATISFATNGTVNPSGQGALIIDDTPNWYTPTTTGIGSSYWIKFSFVSSVFNNGITSGDTLDVWHSLSTARQRTLSTGGDADALYQYSYQISSSSSGTPVVASGTIVLEVINSQF
jgi:hypothetical protein